MRKPVYRQGVYHPTNPRKYRGSLPVIFRSSLELKFCRWCNNNSNVLTWGSESVVLPYISPLDGQLHRYFVDHILLLKTPTGPKKYLVEIKPFKQTQEPKPSKRKKRSTILIEQVNWAKNQAKWEAAKKWAEKHDCTFVILTEKDLK